MSQEIIERTQQLIRRFDGIKIVGAGWSGNARLGFSFDAMEPGAGGGASGGEGEPPTGACCIGSNCSITTFGDCINNGGTWFGPGTLCTPNLCGIPCCGGCGGFAPLEFAGPTYYRQAQRGPPDCVISASDPLDGTERFLIAETTYGPFPDICFPSLSGTVTVVQGIDDVCDELIIDCDGSISDLGITCDCSEYCGQQTNAFSLWCDNCSGVDVLVETSSIELTNQCDPDC